MPVIQFKLSDIGEGIAEVQVKEWHVKEGDRVEQFDNICEVQSDKASVTITSRYDGTKEDKSAEEPKIESGKTSEEELTEKDTEEKKVLATPVVRHFAKEHGVSLSEVTGTGPHGRILKDDVLRFVAQKPGAASATKAVPQVSVEAMPPPASFPRPFVPAKKVLFWELRKNRTFKNRNLNVLIFCAPLNNQSVDDVWSSASRANIRYWVNDIRCAAPSIVFVCELSKQQ
ncbi:unnamed protein product [Gongylonema pulchrum]|uniref:Lipoamide acyltransferase component of branched-chain alpha-keto acid dehydrogenase complex, mitochondrial n=1 Tax=Gongylonema pulchrum TaxID=637853 RepID=A0A3P6PA17_9BILA|nr:unnamed protein product [Gongylonema pulchrum]